MAGQPIRFVVAVIAVCLAAIPRVRPVAAGAASQSAWQGTRNSAGAWPRVQRLSPRVLVITLDPAQKDNTVVLAGRRGLVLIDTDTSQSYARELKAIVKRELGRGDFAYIINTHDDWDHTGGNQVFAGASIIGQLKCYEILHRQQQTEAEEVKKERKWALDMVASAKARLAKRGADYDETKAQRDRDAIVRFGRYADDLGHGFRVTPPNVVFTDRMVLDIGDLTVRLIYFGRAHKEGDTLVYVAEEKLLMSGDLSFDTDIVGEVAQERYQGQWDVSRWLEALHEVMDDTPGVTSVVHGHDNIDTGAWLSVRRRYLNELWEGVLSARRRGLALGQAADEMSLDGPFAYMKNSNPTVDTTELQRRHRKLVEMFWEQAGHIPFADASHGFQDWRQED